MTDLASRPTSAPPIERFLEPAISRAIRTPLHSVNGLLELLAMTTLDDEQRQLTADLMTSSEELARGGDRITWLARIVAGNHRLRVRPVDLVELVGEVASATGIPIQPFLRDAAPSVVHTDPDAVAHVLGELVTNAVRHGSPPVRVEIAGAPSEGGVHITVTDCGAGMDTDTFDELRGVTPPTTVGLSMIAGLVRMLDSRIDVMTGPQGTRATVCLSVRAIDEVARAPQTSDAPPASGLRVLLVEDNATNRLLAERQLKRLGHEMIAVETGCAGIDKALEGVADVVLMDLHLPDVDGCEAARVIRADEASGGHKIPIIAVTADATPEAAAACRDAGMDEVLTKPVDLDGLAAALDRAARSTGTPHTDPDHGVAAPHQAATAPSTVHHVLQKVGGHATLAAELISVYAAELPGRRLRIQAALRVGNLRSAAAAADSLRTSSESVGATALVGTCSALGAAADAGDLASARAFLPMLSATCERYSRELAPYRNAESVSLAIGTPA